MNIIEFVIIYISSIVFSHAEADWLDKKNVFQPWKLTADSERSGWVGFCFSGGSLSHQEENRKAKRKRERKDLYEMLLSM